MATNNEIEFKQLLSKDHYQAIYDTYFLDTKPFSQTNYYIDTPNFDLKSHHSALRIRIKDDTYEMTLKVPAEIGLMEYNFDTKVEPKLNMLIKSQDLPQDILNQLLKMDVDVDDLIVLGALTTERIETEIHGNLLVLDKNQYLDFEDFELEYEVNEYNEGLIQFKSILNQFNINHEIPNNKVQRFFNRKHKLSDS
ncbi:CYTH domain-containing protein [Staphylococcus cohnii]|uniref:Adenylate cyclase n=1 Tax=Staphylococcus cohnii subsp. cohnii TaxID=74704 RepID=A0A0M2NXR5_STACC|nr:CYTH domain-containing protein [Staphylococcus cohnii]TGP62165.1 CYTH domain-containing protein [bacterium M00.F.Ca.ET.229.01.1.1]TGS38839.1 CYTH domain-containing protein [bacterium M00.F.Ca.ET.180.01.1.1]AYX89441.1 CYTH domain-containing protein [Staphylococcus cohnii]KKI63309.1 Adenylate cyclase [Staphylococcus cohnii subsp. cohnii]MCI2941795.1 CYTH domain-containing protein [Staphylococcus cohnii]